MSSAHKIKIYYFLIIAFLPTIFFSANTLAAISEEEALSFGSFAIATNDAASTLTVSKRGGSSIATYRIYPLTHGQPGSYRLSAFPKFMPLIININNFQLNRNFSQPLLIENFDFDPIITDADGAALLTLGATLKTNGAGGFYGDGNYSGTMNITVSW